MINTQAIHDKWRKIDEDTARLMRTGEEFYRWTVTPDMTKDVFELLAEVKRLRKELEFIAHVDLTKNAYNIEHVAVSVKSWALNVLDGVNHDGSK